MVTDNGLLVQCLWAMGYPMVLVVVDLGNSVCPVGLGLMPPVASLTSVPLLSHNLTDAGSYPATSMSGAYGVMCQP